MRRPSHRNGEETSITRWRQGWIDERIKLFSTSPLLCSGNREAYEQGSGNTLLDRRQAVTESNLQHMSSNIPCCSVTKGLGSNSNTRARAFVHSTSVSADGTQEGEIVQEGELVYHVKSRRHIMGQRSAQEAEQGITLSCWIFKRLQEFYYWGVVARCVTTTTIGKMKAEQQQYCWFGHSNVEVL